MNVAGAVLIARNDISCRMRNRVNEPDASFHYEHFGLIARSALDARSSIEN